MAFTERVTIVGAGAIGGTLGAYLSAAGHDVLLVDSVQEHVEAIRERGLRITGLRGERLFKIAAKTPDELDENLEFVILAVKAQHTLAALEPIAPLLQADGFVVSLQNGLCEETIAARIGTERTVGAFVHFGADYQEPGHILLASEVPMRVGELDGALTPRLTRIAGVLAAAMPTALTTNIWGYLWGKLSYGALAFAAALVDRPFGEVIANPEHQATLIAAAREAGLTAAAQHVRLEHVGGLDPNVFLDESAAKNALNAMAAGSRGSLKQYTGVQRDIMVRHRPTEIDHQCGAIAQRARRLGLRAPYCEATVKLIKEVESGARPLGWQNLHDLRAMASGAPA